MAKKRAVLPDTTADLEKLMAILKGIMDHSVDPHLPEERRQAFADVCDVIDPDLRKTTDPLGFDQTLELVKYW